MLTSSVKSQVYLVKSFFFAFLTRPSSAALERQHLQTTHGVEVVICCFLEEFLDSKREAPNLGIADHLHRFKAKRAFALPRKAKALRRNSFKGT